jgi:hypothetical protein
VLHAASEGVRGGLRTVRLNRVAYGAICTFTEPVDLSAAVRNAAGRRPHISPADRYCETSQVVGVGLRHLAERLTGMWTERDSSYTEGLLYLRKTSMAMSQKGAMGMLEGSRLSTVRTP